MLSPVNYFREKILSQMSDRVASTSLLLQRLLSRRFKKSACLFLSYFIKNYSCFRVIPNNIELTLEVFSYTGQYSDATKYLDHFKFFKGCLPQILLSPFLNNSWSFILFSALSLYKSSHPEVFC